VGAEYLDADQTAYKIQVSFEFHRHWAQRNVTGC
jgi:hypothetical protein